MKKYTLTLKVSREFEAPDDPAAREKTGRLAAAWVEMGGLKEKEFKLTLREVKGKETRVVRID